MAKYPRRARARQLQTDPPSPPTTDQQTDELLKSANLDGYDAPPGSAAKKDPADWGRLIVQIRDVASSDQAEVDRLTAELKDARARLRLSTISLLDMVDLAARAPVRKPRSKPRRGRRGGAR